MLFAIIRRMSLPNPPLPPSAPLPDLSGCALEPIHVPGAVQPHGALLALAGDPLVVQQASANARLFFGASPAQLLGRTLTDLLPAAVAARLNAALDTPELSEINPLRVDLGGRAFDASCNRSGGALLLEVEPAGANEGDPSRPGLDQVLRRLARCESLSALADVTAQAVRELTGFERVMVYRFDSDDHGEVVAETKLDELEAFLGLHYPESDIPRQARQLYLRNWIRCIPDALYAPVPLEPLLQPSTGKPLDLSHSTLRSVSPVHLAYMANMGVRASMSVSLIVDGRLWGLISAIHRTPHPVAPWLRSHCETIGRVVSLQIGALEALDFRRRQQAKGEAIALLVASMEVAGKDVLDGLARETDALLQLTDAAGVAVVTPGTLHTAGACPPEPVLRRLAGWVTERASGDGILHTHALSIDDPAWAPWSAQLGGLLAILLPAAAPRCVMWMRPELAHTVTWGGNPNKAGRVEPGSGLPRLHPRRSFEQWSEVVRGRSAKWEAPELHAAAELRRRAVDADLERQIAKEREAVRARDELVAVVSHDLRTPMSVIVLQAAIIQRLINDNTAGAMQRLLTAAAVIHRAGGRVNALLHDLIDLARIEAGRFTVATVSVPADRLVAEACELMDGLAQTASIRLTRETVADVAVRADPERVFQVLANLIGNAIKHAAGSAQVRIGAAVKGCMCEFWVADDGEGIAATHLERIFDRYWQGKPGDSAGAGLGLHIAKGIVEAHGGQLRASSAPGAGATFWFTLPLA